MLTIDRNILPGMKPTRHSFSKYVFSNMFVSNAIDNFDANLRKNIYRFRQRVYKIDNNLIKCLNNCKDILNGPMWSSWSQALYCQRQ